MKVLGAARQSRTADRSISLDAQREAIEAWSTGKTLVAITSDASTSGGTSVFNRAGIGPWFDRPGQWDVLVATKLDRLCRDVTDYMRLRDWCQEHRKRIVLLNQPELDETKPAGKAMTSLLAIFAEFERDMIKERARERHAYITAAGRWNGGRIPFGKMPERREDGVYLVTDPDSALPDMIAKAIAGDTNAAISRWLNASGIKTEVGNLWKPATVRLVLTRVAKDDDELAAALASRAQPKRGEWSSGQHMLLRVAYCAEGNEPLYAAKNEKKPGGGYYHCLSHPVYAQIAKLEAGVESELKGRWRGRKYWRWDVTAGDDHSREIARLERQLDSIRGMPFVDTGKLETEITRLKALPYKAPERKRVMTDELIQHHWDKLTISERGQFLRENGVRVLVGQGGYFVVESTGTASWD